MKKNMLKSLFGSILIFVSIGSNAQASMLGLDTEPPTIESSFAVIDYFEFLSDGDLSTFGAVVDFVDGVSPNGLTEIGFGVGFDLSNPTVGATGGFDVFDQNGLFLGGNLEAVGFSGDLIEFQFGSLVGAAAGSFNTSVLMVIAFDDALGPNPFDVLVDGSFYDASVSISNVRETSQVPVPATLPLILAALVALLWTGRRREAEGTV